MVMDMVTLIMVGDTHIMDMDGDIHITHITVTATDAVILIMDITTIHIIQAEEDLLMLMEQMADIPKVITGILKTTLTEVLITIPEIVQQIALPEIAHHLPDAIIHNLKIVQPIIIHQAEQETIQLLKVTEVQIQTVAALEIITTQALPDLTATLVQVVTVADQEEVHMEVVHMEVAVAEDRLVAVAEEDKSSFPFSLKTKIYSN